MRRKHHDGRCWDLTDVHGQQRPGPRPVRYDHSANNPVGITVGEAKVFRCDKPGFWRGNISKGRRWTRHQRPDVLMISCH
jgi:hypothetical protein